MIRRRKFKPGDRVAWTQEHLRSVGEGPTSTSWRARGVVLQWVETWVQVRWERDDGLLVHLVHPSKLFRIGDLDSRNST